MDTRRVCPLCATRRRDAVRGFSAGATGNPQGMPSLLSSLPVAHLLGGLERPVSPRVLLVTGASSGIGRALVRQAAERGDHLALLARSEGGLNEVAAEAEAAGAASTQVVTADVGDDQEVARAVAEVVSHFGRLDAVVHSAGVVAYGRVDEMPAQVFDAVLRTNLIGSVNVSRQALKAMRAQGRGSLVLVGSVIGHIAAPGMTPYVVSKWGVRALARQLQLENRDLAHVHISYVAPGGVDTPIYDQGADFTGDAPEPPPPVQTPEHVAEVLLRRIDHPRARTQVGGANDLMRFGFSFLPGVYDALVGPLMSVLALDPSRQEDDRTGNVMSADGSKDALRGDHDPAPARLVRQLAATARNLSKALS